MRAERTQFQSNIFRRSRRGAGTAQWRIDNNNKHCQSTITFCCLQLLMQRLVQVSRRMAATTALYEKAEAYWASVSSDVDGMLGGFAHLHAPDISESKRFLNQLFTKNRVGRFRAIDCGCGIGRVSKHLLLPAFHTIDMIDVTESFIEQSAKYLGADNQRVGRKFVQGLQDFVPEKGHYDVIWIQWVSGHLTDDDFVDFFKRCKEGLKEGGCVVLKENLSSSGKTDFDEEDHSYTRPHEKILELFEKADLKLLREKKQSNFPKGMYEVRMFALQ